MSGTYMYTWHAHPLSLTHTHSRTRTHTQISYGVDRREVSALACIDWFSEDLVMRANEPATEAKVILAGKVRVRMFRAKKPATEAKVLGYVRARVEACTHYPHACTRAYAHTRCTMHTGQTI